MKLRIYSVQKKSVAEALMQGKYKPDLRLSFAKEHGFFMSAYKFMKSTYESTTGVSMDTYESGLWGYSNHIYIDKSLLSGDDVLCEFVVDESNVLFSSLVIWDSILDGSISPDEAKILLLNSKVGIQQAYFATSAIESMSFTKLSVV